MRDWREHFARRVELKRVCGWVSDCSKRVNSWTKESWADEVAYQVMLALRQSVYDEMYEACGGDGKKFREMPDPFEDMSFLTKGEYGHYLKEAVQSFLAAQPLPEEYGEQ